MGMSSKKSTKRETSHTTQNVTTTPNAPAWASDALHGFTDKVTGLMDRNPLDFVAPANSLQSNAATAAGNLGGWKSTLQSGIDTALQAANTRTVPGATSAGTTTAGTTTAGMVNSPGHINLQTVAAGQVNAPDAVTTGATDKVTGSSLLEGLNSYFNPYNDYVRKTALADLDVEAGRTRAAQAAAGARNAAFGGSRFGVREAQTEGELSRARASTDSGLLSAAFNAATEMSDRDAARRQGAAIANQTAQGLDLGRRLTADTGNADRQVNVDTGNADRNLTAATTNADLSLRAQDADLGRDLTLATGNADRSLLSDTGNVDRALTSDRANADRALLSDTGNADRTLTSDRSNADRLVSAGGLLGDLSATMGDQARGDIDAQLSAGDTLRDIDSEQRNAPLGLMGAIGDLLGKGQFDLLTGSTTNGQVDSDTLTKIKENPSLMAQIGQAVQIATKLGDLIPGGKFGAGMGAIVSDERAKSDIQTLGHDERGRRWVSWRYLWEPEQAPRHTGVIAQEIAQSDPDAVVPGPFGLLAVDYSKLEGAPWRAS